MINNQNNFFSQVYKVVQQIPLGMVSTYGEVAKAVRSNDARKIGWALHANKSLSVPCHRVVNKDGRVAESYAFGGAQEQKGKLLTEGVGFIDDLHVDLSKHLATADDLVQNDH